ncbi:helix-turn-helix transcriptional regulator [Brevibacterium aurantiacum]|uniref:helix-turn-helix transcriptional regulator n=1 Tax=Brevibacterium aurantiacum TaxID=273384 RepID=UPI0018680A39|nr:helix-turn-helix transcriptional regulator [Brevibacterium aurantiacum]
MRSKVRELRTDRGWSQVQLATALGVSRQTVNALETGRYVPSLTLAFRASAIFELPIEHIFFPTEDDAPPSGGRQ